MRGNITFREVELALPGLSDDARLPVGDLRVEDGIITQIGVVDAPIGEVVDGRGLTLMPGVIDPQVHFREPGAEHKEDLESGGRAAAAGGVTSLLEMPNTKPPTVTREALLDKHARAEGRCRAHWGFFFGATPENALVARDVEDLACGVKVFMGSSTGTLLVDSDEALEAHFASGSRLPIAVHAEDEARLRALAAALGAQGPLDVRDHPRLRDPEAAVRATRRAVALAERYKRRLHILHLSTAEEVELLAGRPRDGLVTSETLPQYLWLDERDYERLGTRVQMNPPVRDARHGAALWKGLREGVIDCMATDHAPHTLAEKALPYGQAPSGMPGVQTLLPLMLHAAHLGHCTLPQVVRWLCEGPARVWSLPSKGRLAVGADADLVLVDRRRPRLMRDIDMHSRCGWTPFAGWTLVGAPVITLLLGRPVYRDDGFPPDVYGGALRFSH